MVSRREPRPMHELEEAAQGQELYRPPGRELHMEQAREQAEASGWLPPDTVYDWPSNETQQRIVNRRQDLYEAMRRLESSVARASGQPDWGDEVRRALIGLQVSLARHIAETEARDGLFAEVVERAPNLATDVDSLRREHTRMMTACRETLEMVEAEPTDADTIRFKVLAILARIAMHRQRGSELLFDTYNVDLAAAN